MACSYLAAEFSGFGVCQKDACRLTLFLKWFARKRGGALGEGARARAGVRSERPVSEPAGKLAWARPRRDWVFLFFFSAHFVFKISFIVL